MNPSRLAEEVSIFYLELLARGVPDYQATLLAQSYTQTCITTRMFEQNNTQTQNQANQLFKINYGGNDEDTGV